jgi:hypothetical protein
MGATGIRASSTSRRAAEAGRRSKKRLGTRPCIWRGRVIATANWKRLWLAKPAFDGLVVRAGADRGCKCRRFSSETTQASPLRTSQPSTRYRFDGFVMSGRGKPAKGMHTRQAIYRDAGRLGERQARDHGSGDRDHPCRVRGSGDRRWRRLDTNRSARHQQPHGYRLPRRLDDRR